MCEMLLRHGADISGHHWFDIAPVQCASTFEVLKYLLEEESGWGEISGTVDRKFAVRMNDKWVRVNMLQNWARKGDIDAVKLLLKRGTKKG